jgi:hypothetical protein
MKGARCWRITPVILATQKAEIRRIMGAGGVAQSVGFEFKLQYHKNK